MHDDFCHMCETNAEKLKSETYPVRRNAVVSVRKVIAAGADRHYRPPTNHEVGPLSAWAAKILGWGGLMDTSVYFGVECRGCENRIAQVEVISGPRIYQWFVPRVPPFEVRRGELRDISNLSSSARIVFEAPTLDYLETHPTFHYV
jgi:hypothetical protein